MLNVFIPHRWHNDDFTEINALLDRTKYNVRDYSVPKEKAFDKVDYRYKVDPKIQKQIDYANVVVCSNRPAIGMGMSEDEIKYAISKNKTVVAVQVTSETSSVINELGIKVIPKRKDSLENWIASNI